jgi:hypothetical protein
MQRFKAITMGKPVVMGRKTFAVDRQAASRADQYRGHARCTPKSDFRAPARGRAGRSFACARPRGRLRRCAAAFRH